MRSRPPLTGQVTLRHWRNRAGSGNQHSRPHPQPSHGYLRHPSGSLMYTIKYGFDFGRVARRGLENVRAELLEKVLAYNFCRLAACRAAKAREESLARAA